MSSAVSQTPSYPVYTDMKKAAQIIMAREQGELELIDRKTFNYLLNRVYRNQANSDDPIYRIPTSEILGFLGHSSADRLHESLSRLGNVIVVIDYIDEDGVKHSARVHYLSYDLSRATDGMVEFAFDALLMRFLHSPKVFATLSMSAIKSFRSSYAARLYEIMALQLNKRFPVWETTIENFREVMALRDEYLRYDNLKRRVIDVAISEVNDIAPFSVKMEEIRSGRGGRIVTLKFASLLKGAQTMQGLGEIKDVPSSHGRPKFRDQNTVDLFDGRTDSERPELEIDAESIGAAVLMLGDREEELNSMVEEWKKRMHGRLVRSPGRAFLVWLEIQLSRSDRESDLEILDDDTIATMVEQWEGAR